MYTVLSQNKVDKFYTHTIIENSTLFCTRALTLTPNDV